ncbi:class I SAM-dependent methyltransferase [Ideonella sp.]|uniref:class I SAM-dependent methyltransferase n=1 Tax=Ideonella sp. TaxID=1929293 RepID=UPI0035B03BA4
MSTALLDSMNRACYGAPGSVAGMAMQQGFTDEGERVAFELLAGEMRDRRILDLGVGPGRTVPLLRSISERYVGLDYVVPMVSAARERHPQADIRLGDARDLKGVADGSQALVVFSFHGIDSVDHDDRRRVLDEAFRVLEPGGVFWFSTLNVAGPAARYRPWWPLMLQASPRPARWVRQALAWAREMARVPVYTTRYWHSRALSEAGGGWSVAPFFAGGWRLVAHYVSLRELRCELAAAGFDDDPDVFEDAHGRRLVAGEDLRSVFGFNVLARKSQG